MDQDEKVDILLVDDRPDKRLALEAALSDMPLNIVTANSGRDALRWLLKREFALVLLDVNMPGMDGFETAQLIRQRKSTEDLPIIFLTAYQDDIFAARGYALGAVDYFVKPIDREALLARLDRYRFTSADERRIERVLVADDDPRANEIMAATLRPLGIEVLVASGGEEAIALARTEHPDLLLLDLMMPVVSGFEVVAQLRADESTRDIPILVITAKDLTPEDKEQLNGHVAAIMQKGTFGSVELIGWLGDLEKRLDLPGDTVAALQVRDPA